MKRILCSLLVATLPFGSVLADAPKSKNAKVTLVYQHELPDLSGMSAVWSLWGQADIEQTARHPNL
jgi:hypothetical protein